MSTRYSRQTVICQKLCTFWTTEVRYEICTINSTVIITSNVASRHRCPKQKLRAGYRAPSLQHTSYLCALLLCEASSTFHRQVWYCVLSVHVVPVFEVRSSSSPPRLPLRQISFLSHPPLPVDKNCIFNHSPSLFDPPGTEAFVLELLFKEWISVIVSAKNWFTVAATAI